MEDYGTVLLQDVPRGSRCYVEVKAGVALGMVATTNEVTFYVRAGRALLRCRTGFQHWETKVHVKKGSWQVVFVRFDEETIVV